MLVVFVTSYLLTFTLLLTDEIKSVFFSCHCQKKSKGKKGEKSQNNSRKDDGGVLNFSNLCISLNMCVCVCLHKRCKKLLFVLFRSLLCLDHC